MTIVGLRPYLRLAACTLSIGLIAGGMAASAQASCGDYVMIGGEGGHAGMSGRHGSNEATSPATQDSATLPRRPCSGPECSRRIPEPEKLPLTLTSAAGQQWGMSVPSVPFARPRPAGNASFEPSFHELLHSGSVFRPPRLA